MSKAERARQKEARKDARGLVKPELANRKAARAARKASKAAFNAKIAAAGGMAAYAKASKAALIKERQDAVSAKASEQVTDR